MLEDRLNQTAVAGQRFEVIPAGVSGWGTDQQLLWFRKYGVAYQPDLVVLAFFPGQRFSKQRRGAGSRQHGTGHEALLSAKERRGRR